MITQKTKIKAEFNRRGIQITDEALVTIDDLISRAVNGLVTEAENNNIKHVNGDLGRIIGGFGAGQKVACNRCGDIEDDTIRWAHQIQQYIAEQALKKLKTLR